MPVERRVQRLGVTMRECEDVSTRERRDALSQDWARFFGAAIPEVHWCPIPNVGLAAACYARQWGLDAICFSGGDDIGGDTPRDITEKALLGYCAGEGLPVFGVCRGAQRIWSAHGGRLTPLAGHARARHAIEIVSSPIAIAPRRVVNSYHRLGLDAAAMPAGLQALARGADGSEEAILGLGSPLLAVMWHPEREAQADPCDIRLLRWLFGWTTGEA